MSARPAGAYLGSRHCGAVRTRVRGHWRYRAGQTELLSEGGDTPVDGNVPPCTGTRRRYGW